MFRGYGQTVVRVMEPLGERIGPFIFWPLLVILLGVIVWAMVKKSRQQRGSPARMGSKRRQTSSGRSGKTWTRPEDYREHHRVAWSEDPSAFSPGPLHWPLAVAAVFGICTGDPWDRLAFRSLDNARSGLQEAWGIRSRGQLLSRLHWILREGHRVDYALEIEQWSGWDKAAVAEQARRWEKHRTEDAAELAWRLRQVGANARGIRETRFEAWDLVRAAMLCRAGYSLGWLTEEETVDTLNLLSARLQLAYSGWEEMGEHFMRARWYWGGPGPEARQEEAHDISRQGALLDPDRGPWARVPWSQPIPDSRVLLADALVAEELVVQAPDDSPTPLARIIDEVTESRLAERA